MVKTVPFKQSDLLKAFFTKFQMTSRNPKMDDSISDVRFYIVVSFSLPIKIVHLCKILGNR